MALDPRIARMKRRLLTSPYEICLARALHFTRAYRESEGRHPALRNALALKRTLESQRIRIEPDEWLAGSKTEKFLAGPLSVERGDFLRSLQLELDVLHLKQRPFRMSQEDKKLFLEEILPYWDGKTLRDRKAAGWERRGLIDTRSSTLELPRRLRDLWRFLRYHTAESGKRLLGANLKGPPSLSRLRRAWILRHELAKNNPTPAVYCFDVQGHLSLGVDKVIREGMQAIIDRANRKIETLSPGQEKERDFLQAVAISLQAAVAYAGRFAELAVNLAERADTPAEKERLLKISRNLERVPRLRPRTFHEAVQAVWFAQLVGEIQYGTHEVFAMGRLDQYLWPFYRDDVKAGRLSREDSLALLQELLLKLSANVEPIPEAGMETNGVLGNSQHVVTIGGVTPEGEDAANELTFLVLDAYQQMGGAVNQLCLRLSPKNPPELFRRAAQVFGQAGGRAVYNDGVIVPALESDGLSRADASDYCIVGCIETSGQSNTHGCPGGHELVLPAVLWLALSRGRLPPPAAGQQRGFDSGDPFACKGFEQFTEVFRRQLAHQIGVLIEAAAEKDVAYREFLQAPYVSALMDDCVERARDMTAGGARYDFTSLAVHGLATLVDSLLAIEAFVYQRRELKLSELVAVLEKNFAGCEALRQRLIHRAPKYGTGDARADRLARQVVGWIAAAVAGQKNARGGRWRVCYYSYGNHVVDGLLLGATPDGRRRSEPISNGISPSNKIDLSCGPTGPLKSAASIPPEEASCGVSLNLRFHPSFLRGAKAVDTFAGMLKTYFELGGMHLQPNVVSAQTLREAQAHPENFRDLVVKVSGYSAYFTDLGRSIQEDIIARHEFARR